MHNKNQKKNNNNKHMETESSSYAFIFDKLSGTALVFGYFNFCPHQFSVLYDDKIC